MKIYKEEFQAGRYCYEPGCNTNAVTEVIVLNPARGKRELSPACDEHANRWRTAEHLSGDTENDFRGQFELSPNDV